MFDRVQDGWRFLLHVALEDIVMKVTTHEGLTDDFPKETAFAELLVREVDPLTLGNICLFLQNSRDRIDRMAEVLDAAKDLREGIGNLLNFLATRVMQQEWNAVPEDLRTAALTDEERDVLGVLPDEDDPSICAARFCAEMNNEFGLGLP